MHQDSLFRLSSMAKTIAAAVFFDVTADEVAEAHADIGGQA